MSAQHAEETPARHAALAAARQEAQAAYLWTRLKNERWSIRTLEARTGITRGIIYSRVVKGAVPLSVADVEVFADVLSTSPGELYSQLLEAANNRERDYSPGVSALVSPFIPRRRTAPKNVTPRPVAHIHQPRSASAAHA